MSQSSLDADEARHELYQVMKLDASFEEKAERALALGESYLGVDNGHVTKINPDSDYWKAIASTDPEDGQYPPGLVLDLETTYCRRTLQQEGPVALHDAPEQGWDDDPAFEAHGLHCYHGTTISIDDESYGTVCFVSRESRPEPFSDDETLFAELIGRLLEHELQRSRTDDKVERLEEFAAVISHDLRNPLNVAQSRLELERQTRDSANLETAVASLDRIEQLIDDVLAAAKQGQTIGETEPMSLSALAEQSWETVATANATVTIDSNLEFVGDPDRSRQLLENLFRNSVEHGGPTVSVRVGDLGEDAGFYVADDGPGIDPAKRDHVFESGYSTGPDGIGLGLSIVQGIVAAHGWSIRVTESAAGGARFEVRGVETEPTA